MTQDPGEIRLATLTFVDPQVPGQLVLDTPAPLAQQEWPDQAPRLPGLTDAVIAGAGRMLTIEQVLAQLAWSSLVVVRDVRAGRGELVHEAYAPGVGRESRLLGASMTKSALAHLVGLAVTDGRSTARSPRPPRGR